MPEGTHDDDLYELEREVNESWTQIEAIRETISSHEEE